MKELTFNESELADGVQSLLGKSINNVSAIRIHATEITAEIEANLNQAIQVILDRFGATKLFTAVSLTLKELATNAAKANLKHYLRNRWEKDAKSAPKDFMEEFRQILGNHGMSTYAPELKAEGLDVQIHMEFDKTKLILKVINGISPSESEKCRVQEKLKQAQGNPDLRKLHAENKADAEGAGLGMVLVMNALRSNGIDPKALTYDLQQANQVIAEVVFPFSAGKKSLEKTTHPQE